MFRHFIKLYLLIVGTLVAVSWGQDRIWDAYSASTRATSSADPESALLSLVEEATRAAPPEGRAEAIADLSMRVGVRLDLIDMADIAGERTRALLQRGELAEMRAANGDIWLMRRMQDEPRVLAFKYQVPAAERGWLEWTLALIFYAAIALVIMAWLWPLTRDLRKLEQATVSFGNRHWKFDADVSPRSQVHPLSLAFDRMAKRIDGLVASQRDMSNALSHEIKTPLARMRFEVEMARNANVSDEVAQRLNSIERDIAEIDEFVTATLEYAILERAEVSLQVSEHDFSAVVPAIVESVMRSVPEGVNMSCKVTNDATRVACDAHLVETVLKNLLYNAMRHASRQVYVSFEQSSAGLYTLRVEDDGPGIPEPDRERVFGSFVQLGDKNGKPGSYGLGLAIVKRIAEWHGGAVTASRSELGGACIEVRWRATDLPQ